MTEIEMSLNHTEEDMQMCIAKFECGKNDGSAENIETDPLALDDEEKMDLDDSEKEEVVEEVNQVSDSNNPEMALQECESKVSKELKTFEVQPTDPLNSKLDIDHTCRFEKDIVELNYTKSEVNVTVDMESVNDKEIKANDSIIESDIKECVLALKSTLTNGNTQNVNNVLEEKDLLQNEEKAEHKTENNKLFKPQSPVFSNDTEDTFTALKDLNEIVNKPDSSKVKDAEIKLFQSPKSDDIENEVSKCVKEGKIENESIKEEKDDIKENLQNAKCDVPSEVTLESAKDEMVIDSVDEEPSDNIYKQENFSSGDSDVDESALHIVEDTPAPAEKNITEDNEKKEPGTSKRRNDETEQVKNEQNPSKKLCQELQESFEKHNQMLSDYISNSSNNTVEEIDKHTETLISEIETLRELAQTKEMEWNNILHLKKVKEEILLRLIRRKKVILLEKVNHDIAESKKILANKKNSSSSKSLVQDKYDEVTALNLAKCSANNVKFVNNHPIMSPITSLPYCPISTLEKNINYYGKQKIAPKPVMMMPGPRLPAYQLLDRNGQLDNFGMPMGRQGPTKDVQSIIADYRQRHPEIVPRRGRRMKSLLNSQTPQIAVGPRPIAPHPDHTMDLGLLLGRMEGNPHMSVSDAIVSQQNAMLAHQQQMQQQASMLPSSVMSPGPLPQGLPNGMSFKDVLVQFASMGGGGGGGGGVGGMQGPPLPPPPPYPEVTLHPVPGTGGPGGGGKMQQQHQQQQQQNNSLLHGILTKSQPRQDNRFSTFSPTLARLLTAPEKVMPPCTMPTSTGYVPQKNCMEITITPVPHNSQNNTRTEPEVVQLEDFEDGEGEEERPLVIDEGESGGVGVGGSGNAVEVSESEVPECQGCHRKEAQFVCAGCANQWYCSRECQVSAWDEHSEVCSG